MKHLHLKIRSALGLFLILMTVFFIAGCGNAADDAIHVIVREDGSGTRSAFVRLFGIEAPNVDGGKTDCTRPDAAVTNSTAVMMTNIAGDLNGIGYLSLRALNETVKAVRIDGVSPTADNIRNGTYKAARPFHLVTGGNGSEAAQDFLRFILSADGQSVVEREQYIAAVENAKPYKGSQPTGKVVVAGSSSVTPVMEALKEDYLQVNPNCDIEIQTSDSTTGIHAVKEGICDMGMASRSLNNGEAASGLTATAIATDGIAVIVHRQNPVENLTGEQVCAIFTGQVNNWSALN